MRAFFHLFFLFCLVLFLPIFSVHAQTTDYGSVLRDIGEKSGVAQIGGAVAAGGDVLSIVGKIIGVALSLLGIIFLILMIYAGFLWMTAGGVSDQVDKAKKILTSSIIGLIIVLAAYALSAFVIEAMTSSVVKPTP